jgi:hypothetical protein
MLIEYYATDLEDRTITKALEKFNILEWFNPEESYYVLETDDERVVTILTMCGADVYISESSRENNE